MRRQLRVNHKLVPFLTKPQPIKVAYGGRGSGKSLGLGDLLTFKMDTEGADIYCLREFQLSISDSVHKVFTGSIEDRLKLDNWSILEKYVQAPNGARTTYRGANRNPDAMQSAQGYLYSWFEEAHRASKASLDKLLPTIIRNPGAQCWFSANPQSSNDAFSQRFLVPYLDVLERDGVYEDDLHYIVRVNWRDNPWWNAEQEQLRQWDFNNRPRAEYDWIWEGAFMDTVEDAIILPEWFDAAVGLAQKLNIKPTGSIVVSHDPADLGGDNKAYVMRHGSIIIDADETQEMDVNDACDWALDRAIEANADAFVYDGDGLGASLRRQVITALTGKNCEIVIHKGGESPKWPGKVYQGERIAGQDANKTNQETFKNKRAQAYWLLRDRFYNAYKAFHGAYIDPNELICINPDIKCLRKMRAEICRVPRVPNGNGLIQIMDKKKMKSLGIPSPGLADSCAQTMLIDAKVGKKQNKHIKFASGW